MTRDREEVTVARVVAERTLGPGGTDRVTVTADRADLGDGPLPVVETLGVLRAGEHNALDGGDDA